VDFLQPPPHTHTHTHTPVPVTTMQSTQLSHGLLSAEFTFRFKIRKRVENRKCGNHKISFIMEGFRKNK